MHVLRYIIVENAEEFAIEQCSMANGTVDVGVCDLGPCPVDCIGDWGTYSDNSFKCIWFNAV